MVCLHLSRWFLSLSIVPNSGGDLWWFAVVCGGFCGGLRWSAMVCGGLS